jgi:hypothetical protein
MRHQRWIAVSMIGLLAVAAACSSGTDGAGATSLPSAPASILPSAVASAPSTAPSASQPASASALGHGQFTSVGSLNASLQTATLLSDSRVLLAAGVSCSSNGLCPNSAEARIYDPATNAFTVVGPLASARSELAATLLADGSILIAGGTDQPTAEIFSATAGGFAPAGAMSADRHGLAAARLSDGRVLVTGGWGGPRGGVKRLGSAEVFDPEAKTFSLTGAMKTARSGHTATTLNDGRVLVVGGRGEYPNSGLASAEIYDPRTGLFSETGSMKAARQNHVAALLPDGRVLIVGGEAGVVATALIEVYDPGSGKFSSAGTMPAALSGVSATTLADGRVLIAGGRPAANDDEALSSNAVAGAYLYDPATGKLSPTGSMTAARERHTATRLADGRVLIAGGWNESGQATSAELYQP